MVPTDRTATTRRATLPYGRTPMSEAEFSDAWAAADAIQPSELRDRISAMLMLARGAGASAADLRYVAGTDIVTLADAGTWVECRRPGFERRVPVSVRFAEDLQRMARQARRETLIGERGQPLPLPAADPDHLAEQLHAQVCLGRPDALITVERLRRAWCVEQLSGALPVREFLCVTGEESWRIVRELSDFCPAPMMDAPQLARLMGGAAALELVDLETWGLD